MRMTPCNFKKAFLTAFISLLVAGTIFSFSSVQAQTPEQISLTVTTVDTAGNEVPGTITNIQEHGVGTILTNVPAPQNLTISNGSGFSFGAFYLGRHRGLTSVSPVIKDTTYQIDAFTGTVTSTATPGINRVEFVFEPIPLTVATVDTAGNEVAGTITNIHENGVGSVLTNVPSPQTLTVSNGGAFSYGARYLGRHRGITSLINPTNPPLKDTTYQIDAFTGTVTSTATPGINRVEIVFEPIPLTVATVDTAGNEVAGTITNIHENGVGSVLTNVPSPQTLTVSNGGAFSYGAIFGGLHRGITSLTNPTNPMLKDTTHQIDAVTGDVTSTATPGENRVELVFPNELPVADAGAGQSVVVGDLVTLDGSASSDPEGSVLTFVWTLLSKPSGSQATLSDSTVVNPQFTADKAGSYVVELIVNDGSQNSDADTVTISTLNSQPVADAGPDQGVTLGNTVQLDGSSSFDPDGDELTYSWTLTSLPIGSLATLSDAAASTPTFVADVVGTYEVSLMVHDGQVPSELDMVIVSTVNVSPIANAGSDQAVQVGNTVSLDGTGSTDPDGMSLTYAWSFASQPTGSSTTLSDPTSPTPSFVADVTGTYLLQLIVNDGTDDSAPDTVSVTVTSGTNVLDLLREAINRISAAPTSAFVNKNSPRALINKLEAVIRQVENGNLSAASNQLTNDLLPKMDGCALRGVPDVSGSGEVRDWIITCEVQGQVYPLLTEAVDLLAILIGS